MKCPSFDELMAFSDGELGSEDAERIEAHIGSCRRCALLVSSQARMEAAWRDSYREPSDGQFERLERDIRSRWPVRRRNLLQWALPVAAALLVAIAGMKFLGRNGSLVREPGQPAAFDSGFETERIPGETAALIEESRAGEETGQPAEQEQSLAGLPPETDTAAMPETVAVTGTHDNIRSASPDGTAGYAPEALFSERLETGALEAQMEGSISTGAESAFGESLQDLSAGSAAAGGGGAAPAGGSGGMAGGGMAASPGFDGDYASDACVVVQSVREDQESDDLTGAAEASEPVSAGTVEEYAAVSQSVCSAVDTTARRRTEATARAYAAGRRFVLFFDAEGTPSSPDAAVLDEAFPGWKDSLSAVCSDSMLVVSGDEISEMMME
ncbi:hypothetical protein GX411_01290 [Candidatus Fermentibacteria bacterium]|nr:hypothetical protein [Candidatus Fermentibacteria bacterium]